MAAALSNLFPDFPGMATRPLGFPVVAFVEAYIEQGPELDLGRPVIRPTSRHDEHLAQPSGNEIWPASQMPWASMNGLIRALC
jgi:hypothetical protein